MKIASQRRVRPHAAPLLLALAILGCTEKPKPPTMDMYGRRGLAILPFRNTSTDATLATSVVTELLAGLDVLKAIPVSGPTVTAGMAAEPTLIPDVATVAKVAEVTGSDLIMTGEVAGYREAVKAGEPKRIKASYRAGSWKWGCADDAVVTFLVTVRLAEVGSGRQVWIRTVNAEGKSSRWIDLAYDGDESKPPQGGWDAIRLKSGIPAAPRPAEGGALPLTSTVAGSSPPQFATDSNLAYARAEAISQVTRAVLNDFTGRGGWVPPRDATPLPPTAPTK